MRPDKKREKVNLIKDNKKSFLNEVSGESQQETECYLRLLTHCVKMAFKGMLKFSSQLYAFGGQSKSAVLNFKGQFIISAPSTAVKNTKNI